MEKPRSPEVQQLKDILNIKCPRDPAPPANPGPEPADSEAAPVPADTPETSTNAESIAVELLDQHRSEPSEHVDAMETLEMPTEETVPMATGEEWPHRPWLPKTTLLRWSTPALHRNGPPTVAVENQE